MLSGSVNTPGQSQQLERLLEEAALWGGASEK